MMAQEQHNSGACADLQDPDGDPAKAPRHGLNAKALLLQAAALAAEEAADIEDSTPVTLSSQEQQIANLEAAFVHAGKLLSGVPKKETPIVAFVNTTKIPRALRQQVLQKLAGQHLVVALLDANLPLTPEKVVTEDDLRKTALKAATEQELKLFKSCMSKASYQNSAARTDASLVKYPPSLPASQPTVPAPAPTPPSTAVQPAAAQEESLSLADQTASAIASPEPNKRRKVCTESQAQPASATASAPLVDDDIDWDKPSEPTEPDMMSKPRTRLENAAGEASCPGHAAKHAEQLRAEAVTAEAMPEPDADSQAPNAAQGQHDRKHVQHAVAEYVKAFLDPFYKAGIVDREMYKLVIKKAAAKVLQNHAHAEDTDFLIQESDHIQKLVREYIRYAQKKLHK